MVGFRQEFSRVDLLTVCIDQYVQKGECECPDLDWLHQFLP